MEVITVILLLFFCFGAAFIQRVTGFGFGIFIMTALPYLISSYGEATALSGLLALVTSLIVSYRMRRHITWHKVLPILITFIATSYIAVCLVATINNQTLKYILGVTLIFVSIYFTFLKERISVRPTMPIQIIMGSISGLMGGFFAMQGPPAVLYFLSAAKTKEEYMANAQIYFLLGNAAMTLFRAKNGFLTKDVVFCWIIMVPMVFIGTWIGGKVFEKIPRDILSKIIYAFIGISGILALVV